MASSPDATPVVPVAGPARGAMARAALPSPRLSLVAWLAIGFGTLLSGGLATLGYQLAISYSRVIETHETQALNLARALRQHADSVLRQAELAMQSLGIDPDSSRLILPAEPHILHEHLRRVVLGSLAFDGIGVVGADGRVQNSSQSMQPVPVDLSDRDYFRTHQTRQDAGLVIGEPVESRPSGRWIIPVSRRADNPDGSFAGVVSARLRPEYFEEFLRALNADVAAITRIDGTVLARHPGGPVYVGRTTGSAAPLIARTRLAPEGTYHAASVFDGILRIVGYQVSGRYPFVVIAAFDREVALAGWRAERDRAIFLAITLVALCLGFGAFAIQRARREAALTAEATAARREAEAARFTAEEADRAKSEFLAHMSHELRTPLNAVIGFGEILSKEMFGQHSNDRYLEYSRNVVLAGGHLLRIINSILDLAKVTAGKWELDETPVSLHAVIDDALVLVQERTLSAGVSIDVEVPDELPRLMADSRVLLQIMLNLVINAVKVSKPGSTVRIIAAVSEDGGVAFQVADTGIGLSPDDIERVLKPFGHPADRAHRKASDTGLGLILSRMFAELHGGSLSIQSQVSVGTTVTIRFPPHRTLKPAG